MYVGLGVVKRIKTNVRHLREENEVERNRQRGRESEWTVGRAYSPWPARMLKVIVSYLVNMQSVCAGVCVWEDLLELIQLFQLDNAPAWVGQCRAGGQ